MGLDAGRGGRALGRTVAGDLKRVKKWRVAREKKRRKTRTLEIALRRRSRQAGCGTQEQNPACQDGVWGTRRCAGGNAGRDEALPGWGALLEFQGEFPTEKFAKRLFAERRAGWSGGVCARAC